MGGNFYLQYRLYGTKEIGKASAMNLGVNTQWGTSSQKPTEYPDGFHEHSLSKYWRFCEVVRTTTSSLGGTWKFSYLVHEAMLRLIQSYEWDVVSSVSVLSFIYLSFCLPIHFVYLYTCVCLSVPLFVCQKAGLAVSPSIHLSGVRFAGTLLLWQIAHP